MNVVHGDEGELCRQSQYRHCRIVHANCSAEVTQAAAAAAAAYEFAREGARLRGGVFEPLGCIAPVNVVLYLLARWNSRS